MSASLAPDTFARAKPADHGWRFILRTAVAYLGRDWRAGELRVVALAVIIAVTAVSSVSFFTNRVGAALELQASSLLGGDVLLRHSQPLPDMLSEKAAELGLQWVDLVQFPSVVLNQQDDSQLVAVKAVSDGYPLRGKLKIRDTLNGDIRVAQTIPAPGEVWLETRLFLLLSIQPGDEISLGDRTMRATKAIESEPDRSGFLFQLAPRVLLNHEDLESTRLISPGSRVSYRMQLAGDVAVVGDYQDFLEDSEAALGDVVVEDVRNGRPELRNALDRADRFLGLTAIVCVLLAGAAVAVAAQGFAAHQADASAVLRTFGATRKTVFRLMLARMGSIALIASAIGVFCGYLIQYALVSYLTNSIDFVLPEAGWYPYVLGGLTGFICLLGFGLPAIINVDQVPVLRVLRNDLQAPSVSTITTVLFAFAALCLLMVWQAKDLRLAGSVIGGLLGLLAIVAVTSLVLLWLMKRTGMRATPGWRFGATSLLRRQKSVVLQLSAFCVGIMALLLITIVGNGILDAWRDEIPADAPNHFAFNIQRGEVAIAQEVLGDAGVDDSGFYPMARGRMFEINGEEVDQNSFPDGSRAQHLMNRDYNISYAAEAREDTRLRAGEWWGEEDYDSPLISVEAGIADTFDVTVGDELAFRIAGNVIRAKIASIRRVDWDSYQPNFFIIATPGLLAEMPLTYITSFRLVENKTEVTGEFVRQVPGATVIDLEALIARVRGLIDTVSLAVEYVLGFTLIAGLVVLIATVQSSRRERMREAALLKALGAPYKTLLVSLLTEFVMLGAIAGFVAACVAGALGWSIAEVLFELEYRPSVTLLTIGTLSGAIGVGLCGVLVTLRVLQRSPMSLLTSDR